MTINGHTHDELLTTAVGAARTAGELVMNQAPGRVVDKGDRDLVTEADMAAEQLIRKHLDRHTPQIPVLGEEQGGPDPSQGCVWVVDPIDGTVNYLHGLPTFAVTVTLLNAGRTEAAAIYCPATDEMYTATRGGGAHLNGEAVNASHTSSLSQALIAIDQFTFSSSSAAAANKLRSAVLQAIAPVAHRIRINGASALDLAWVAVGRLDACIMLANRPWDTAGGVLLAREAGAAVCDLDGREHRLGSSSTVAAGRAVATELRAALGSIREP